MFCFWKNKSDKNKKTESSTEKIRAHVFVSGRVQGVFFRENARKKARRLGVFGWVKNLKDKRVEAVFEGDKDKVEEMVDWARKGPIWAKIEALDLIWEDYQGESKSKDFEIRYDL